MKNKEILGLRGAYASIYSNLSESHFKVGDEVICKSSGMEGEVVKVDSEEKGKYYTVKREDGKMVKYAPDELKLESEENEDEMKEEVSYSAKKARAGEDIGKPGKAFAKIAKEAGKRYGSEERGKKVAGAVLANLRKEEFDIFDVILEHLVAEGYADTNQAALAIMANMSEEWRENIMERENDEPGESDDRPDVKSHNRAVKYRPRPRRPRRDDDPRYGTVRDRGGNWKY